MSRSLLPPNPIEQTDGDGPRTKLQHKASVVMQRLSYRTETLLSNKITRNKIVLSFKDSPRKPLRRRPSTVQSVGGTSALRELQNELSLFIVLSLHFLRRHRRRVIIVLIPSSFHRKDKRVKRRKEKRWNRGVVIPALDPEAELDCSPFGDSGFGYSKKLYHNTYRGVMIPTLSPDLELDCQPFPLKSGTVAPLRWKNNGF